MKKYSQDFMKTSSHRFWEKVGASKKKKRILSEFQAPDGRRFGFYFGGRGEALLYAQDHPYPHAIDSYDFRSPLRFAPILEDIRKTFKIDPLDSAFVWMMACFQGAQKMMKKKGKG